MAGSLHFHLNQSSDVACPGKDVTAEGRPLTAPLAFPAALPETSLSWKWNLRGACPCPYNLLSVPLRSSSHIFREQLLHGSAGPFFLGDT